MERTNYRPFPHRMRSASSMDQLSDQTMQPTSKSSSQSRTCQNCATSKVRCVRNGTQDCTRCRRLGKQCIDREARRRFNGFQKDLKIKALEAQVDELTKMRDGASSFHKQTNLHQPETLHRDTTTTTTAGAIGKPEDVIGKGLLSMATAESLLSTFKDKMTPHFPFVTIPPGISVDDLRRERSFLLLAILASASFADVSLQRNLDVELKKTVSSLMILNGKASFDMLQGLLVYLAWNHYHARPNRYTQFMQLAIGIVIELRLDRPPQTTTWKVPLQFKHPDNKTYNRQSWGGEEQRAIAGCYYLSSTVAVLTQKQCSFSHSHYIEECCRLLHDAAESPYDRFILHIAQLQHIIERTERLTPSHAIESLTPGSGAELYVESLISDLETFRTNLPFELSECPILSMQFYSAELMLYQLSLCDVESSSSAQPTPSRPLKDKFLDAAMRAVDSTVNLCLSQPIGWEAALNNTQWMQIGFATLVASKLVGASMSAPSKRSVELAPRWPSILEKFRNRIGALCLKNDLCEEKDVFHYFRHRLDQIQNLSNKASGKEASDFPQDSLGLDDRDVPTGTLLGNDFTFLPDEFFGSAIDPLLMMDWANMVDFS